MPVLEKNILSFNFVLNELKIFFGTRNEAEKLENTMYKLIDLQKTTNIDGIIKDITNSVEVLSIDLIEKRKKSRWIKSHDPT